MRIGECTAEDYNYLIKSAANANINFIRVWGGGGVEKQSFYDACDRHGIMVYQETVHSQSMPTRDVNYANERGEVEQMINKLSSHPSVVRYGWGNEYVRQRVHSHHNTAAHPSCGRPATFHLFVPTGIPHYFRQVLWRQPLVQSLRAPI